MESVLGCSIFMKSFVEMSCTDLMWLCKNRRSIPSRCHWHWNSICKSTFSTTVVLLVVVHFPRVPISLTVDVFYMKTCSFRSASPGSDIQGLFCKANGPKATYTMTPCGQRQCTFCHPVLQHRDARSWPVVDFDASSTHRFVNGYTIYLNCPAVCSCHIFCSNERRAYWHLDLHDNQHCLRDDMTVWSFW